MPGKTDDPIEQLREVVARGQAAQRAVDQILAEHSAAGPFDDSAFPPWRRCTEPGCKDDTGEPRWTRGLFCPQHRTQLEAAGEDRGRPAGKANLPPARAVAIQGVTGPRASGAKNAPEKHRRAIARR